MRGAATSGMLQKGIRKRSRMAMLHPTDGDLRDSADSYMQFCITSIWLSEALLPKTIA